MKDLVRLTSEKKVELSPQLHSRLAFVGSLDVVGNFKDILYSKDNRLAMNKLRIYTSSSVQPLINDKDVPILHRNQNLYHSRVKWVSLHSVMG